MSKKIIAISLALLMIVTCFVACGKKYKTTKIGGADVILATDAEGNTIINDKDQFVAIVTDKEGEVLTYENGEEQTYFVNIPGSIVIGGLTRGDNFTLKVLDGWTPTDFNQIFKDGTDNKCYIKFAQTVKNLEKDESLDTHLATIDASNELLIDAFKNDAVMDELIKQNPDIAKYKGCTYTMEKSVTNLTADNLACQVRIHKIVDNTGKVVHYVENYIFVVNNAVYQLDYVCEDGVGYDASFDFRAYANESFTFVK